MTRGGVAAELATAEPAWELPTAAADWLCAADGRRAAAMLLDADPDLARRLTPSLRHRLGPLLRVGVETLERGRWEPEAVSGERPPLGLLVLDGLLVRDLSIRDRRCAELIGRGDLLRPWDPDAGLPPAPTAEMRWQVVGGPARLAVLDRRASLLIGRVPELVSELLDRTLRRARTLQFQLTLTQVRGVADRLDLLLWHLADRWGRMTVEGVVLPLQLTHDVLSRLVGARRPSVTTALRRLRDDGRLVRRRDGWLLLAGSPGLRDPGC